MWLMYDLINSWLVSAIGQLKPLQLNYNSDDLICSFQIEFLRKLGGLDQVEPNMSC